MALGRRWSGKLRGRSRGRWAQRGLEPRAGRHRNPGKIGWEPRKPNGLAVLLTRGAASGVWTACASQRPF